MAKSASSLAKRAGDMMNWLDDRLPVTSFYKAVMTGYQAPKNFNFWYYMGSLALLVLVMQIGTGIFLTMWYKPSSAEAFASVEFIMRDVEWGWFDSLYAHNRCFFLLYPDLPAYVPQPVVRFSQGATRVVVGVRNVYLPGINGGSIPGLHFAMGTDVLLGCTGHH